MGSDAPSRAVNGFWTELDTSYAVFAERLPDRDWAEVGEEACAALGDDPDRDATFDALVGMAEALDDGHVQIDGHGRSGDGWVSAWPHEDAVADGLERLEARVDGAFGSAARSTVGWGRIGEVGVLWIGSMDTSSLTATANADRRASVRAVERAFAEVGDVSAWVVDVRANGGGWDDVSLALVGFFAGPEVLGWQRQVRVGPAHDDLGPWEDILVPASRPDAFAGPTVLITAGGTFSAAETFSLAMSRRPEVVLLGEPTSGHFSDIYDGPRLPGGWRFGYSAERYRDPDGTVLETRGVQVDAPVPFDRPAWDEGTDVQLEAALDLLGR